MVDLGDAAGRKRLGLPPLPDPEDREPNDDPSGARILLVDDDPDIARFIQVHLGSSGYNVDIVGNGVLAWGAATQSSFDLVITNVMMSGIDGFELVRRLRAEPETSELPMMILTAKSTEDDVRLGVASGADDYVVKPFDPVELLAHVRALLRRGRTPR